VGIEPHTPISKYAANTAKLEHINKIKSFNIACGGPVTLKYAENIADNPKAY
jgi:hypothetical protein